MLHPMSGSATIGGRDVWRESVEVKKFVGYMPVELSLGTSHFTQLRIEISSACSQIDTR
jgi:ABC-type multidrug transport system ATPase subunit